MDVLHVLVMVFILYVTCAQISSAACPRLPTTESGIITYVQIRIEERYNSSKDPQPGKGPHFCMEKFLTLQDAKTAEDNILTDLQLWFSRFTTTECVPENFGKFCDPINDKQLNVAFDCTVNNLYGGYKVALRSSKADAYRNRFQKCFDVSN